MVSVATFADRRAFAYTSHIFCTRGAWVGVRFILFCEPTITVNTRECQPIRKANIEVEIAIKAILVALRPIVLQFVKIVCGIAIDPSVGIILNRFSFFIIRIIPRQHRVHRCNIALAIFDICLASVKRRSDSQPCVGVELQFITEIEARVVVTFHCSIFFISGDAEEIAHLFCTTAQGETILLGRTYVCRFFPPVEIAVAQIFIPARESNFGSITERRVIVIEFLSIHHVNVSIVEYRDARLSCNAYFNIARSCVFCCNNNYAVCALATIDCCWGCIFQNSEALYVIGIDVAWIRTNNNTVNHPKRISATIDSRFTANDDRPHRSWLSGTRNNVYTGYLAHEHIAHIRCGCSASQVGTFYSLHGACHTVTTLYSISHNDSFVKIVVLDAELYCHAINSFHCSCFITDKTETKVDTSCSINGEMSFSISDGTRSASCYTNSNTWQRFPSFSINNNARNFLVCYFNTAYCGSMER